MIATATPRCRCGLCYCESCHPAHASRDQATHGATRVGKLRRFMERWCEANGWKLDGCLMLHDGNLEASYR